MLSLGRRKCFSGWPPPCFLGEAFQGMAGDLKALEGSANSPQREKGASQLRGLHLLLFPKGLHVPTLNEGAPSLPSTNPLPSLPPKAYVYAPC